MAGAVLARRYINNPNKEVNPFYSIIDTSRAEMHRVEAFDHLRNYSISAFLENYDIVLGERESLSDHIYDHIFPEERLYLYEADPELFKANMLKIADFLEEKGR